MGKLISLRTGKPLEDTGGTIQNDSGTRAQSALSSLTPSQIEERNRAAAALTGAPVLTAGKSAARSGMKKAAPTSPNFGERVSRAASGAAKTYAAGFTNAGGSVVEGLNRAGTWLQSQKDDRQAAQDRTYLARYQQDLHDALASGDQQAAKTARLRMQSAQARLRTSGELTDYYRSVGDNSAQNVYDTADWLAESGNADVERAKSGLGALGRTVVDVGVAGGQMLADAGLGALTGGSALVPMAVRSFGGGAQEARQAGATYGQQVAYGLGSGAVSVATEKLSNVAKPFKQMFGGGVLDEAITKAAGRLGQTAAGKLVLSALSEGGEEVVEDLVQPILQRATYDKEALGQYGTAEYWANALYDGLIGGVLGGIGAGVEQAGNRVRRLANAGNGPENVADATVKTGERTTAGPAQSGAEGMKNAASRTKAAEGVWTDENGQRNFVGVTAERQADFRAAEQAAARYGAKFRVERLGTGVSGQYQGGTISIDPNAQHPVRQVLVHELTHHMETSGLYGDFQQMVLNYIQNDMGADLPSLRRVVMEQYRQGGTELNEAGADREIVAAFADNKLFQDEMAINRLAQTNRSLFRRIYDWLRDAVTRLTGTDEEKFLRRAEQMYQKALESADGTRAGAEVENLYAGEHSQKANLHKLGQAEQMESDGISSEAIRKETGWFRGMDGKWRWEIDDSGMTYYRGGDAAFSRNHPDYAEYQELMRTWMTGDMTAEKEAHLQRLDETWGQEHGRLSERVERGSATLEDILDHEGLFRAYPQLRRTKVEFSDLPKGTLGSYSPSQNLITLSKELRSAPESTLVHEIQHAIQNAEGFAKGSNRQYWEDRLTSGDEIQSKGFQDAREKLIQFQLDEANEEALRLKDRIEEAGAQDDDLAEYDRLWKEAERRGLDGKINEYYELRDNYYTQMNRPGNSVPSELYYNTAGEIEARDVSVRRMLTAEQRAEKSPAYGDENTVFADSGDGYAMSQGEQDSVKEQLREHQDALNNMKAVATIRDNGWKGMSTGAFRQKIVNDLKKTGYRVDNPDIGVVEFDEKLLNRSLNYIQTDAEAAAYQALPQVLKRGFEISGHGDHKGRGYETLTIAAPVELNGKRGNMAVVVMRTKGNRYKVHRILTPEGTAFALPEMTNAEPNTVGAFTNGSQSLGGSAPAISSAFEASVAEKILPVKKQLFRKDTENKQAFRGIDLEETIRGIRESGLPEVEKERLISAHRREAERLRGQAGNDTMRAENDALKGDGRDGRENAGGRGLQAGSRGESGQTIDREGKERAGGVRGELSTASGRYGVDPTFGIKPVRSWVEDHIVEPAKGSVAYAERQTAVDCGVPRFVVADTVWAENKGSTPAFSANGQLYFRETLPEKNRGMLAPHEITHVMRQVGYKPYLDFLERVPTMLNMSDPLTRKLLDYTAKHQRSETADADPVRLYDELSATIYGHYAAGKLDGISEPLHQVFHDFDTYIMELRELHEQFKHENGGKMNERLDADSLEQNEPGDRMTPQDYARAAADARLRAMEPPLDGVEDIPLMTEAEINEEMKKELPPLEEAKEKEYQYIFTKYNRRSDFINGKTNFTKEELIKAELQDEYQLGKGISELFPGFQKEADIVRKLDEIFQERGTPVSYRELKRIVSKQLGFDDGIAGALEWGQKKGWLQYVSDEKGYVILDGIEPLRSASYDVDKLPIDYCLSFVDRGKIRVTERRKAIDHEGTAASEERTADKWAFDRQREEDRIRSRIAAEDYQKKRQAGRPEEEPPSPADLDELWKLWEDQAHPITDSETRRAEALKAAENMVSPRTVPERETLRKSAEDVRSYFMRKMVDAGDSVTRIEKLVKDPFLYDFYNMARASSSAGVNMITGEQTNISGKPVGKGLNAIFDPIRAKGGAYYDAFQMYLLHLHNIDRMSIVSGNNPALLEAEKALHEFDVEHPDVATLTEARLARWAQSIAPDAELARERLSLLRKVNRADRLANKPVFGYEVSAEESRETAARLLREHPEFAELQQEVRKYIRNLMQYRVDSGLRTKADAEFLERYYPNYVPTYRRKKHTDKRTERRSVRIGSTIGKAVGGDAAIVPLHEALGRQTMAVVREGSKNRFGQRLLSAWDKSRTGIGRYISSVQEFEADFNADTFDSLDEDPAMQKNNTFIVYEDGKLMEMAVDPSLFDAVKALSPDPQETNKLVRGIQTANKIFKALVTGYNPAFTIRNTVRDFQTAGLYSRDALSWIANYLPALGEIKNDGAYWKQYKALGGSFASVFDYRTGTVKEDSKLVQKTLGRVEALNMAMEQAPRLAEFMSIVKKGDGSMENLMDAMHAAADVTVNFGRSGTLGKLLNANFVPFLNPGIQGFDRMIRRVTETRGGREWAKLVIRAALLGIAPALINSLIYRDDDDWEDLRESDKDTNYLFKLKEGVWLKIPKGRELSVLGMTGQRISDLANGKEVNWKDFITTVGNQVAPANPLTNNILTPLMNDVHLFDPKSPGKTWYGGDIESQRLQGYAPGERYDTSTDVFSKWLGRQLNLSPKKINYLLDQYTGVVGDFVLPLLTPRAEQNPLIKAFTVDSVSSNRISGDFYDAGDAITYARNGGDAAMSVVSRYWNKQVSACGDIYKHIREIEESDRLSNAEKRQQVREAKAILNGIQKNALDGLEAYEEAARRHLTGTSEDEIDDAYREANRECFGPEYALRVYSKDVYARAQEANRNGVSYAAFYRYYFDTRDFESTDEKSAAAQKMEYLENANLSERTKAELYFANLASDTELEKAAELEQSCGITPERYWQYKIAVKGLQADKDADGNPISGTKRAKVLDAINGLSLTAAQKDALYLTAGYSEKALHETPWHDIMPKLTGRSGNSYSGRTNSSGRTDHRTGTALDQYSIWNYALR